MNTVNAAPGVVAIAQEHAATMRPPRRRAPSARDPPSRSSMTTADSGGLAEASVVIDAGNGETTTGTFENVYSPRALAPVSNPRLLRRIRQQRDPAPGTVATPSAASTRPRTVPRPWKRRIEERCSPCPRIRADRDVISSVAGCCASSTSVPSRGRSRSRSCRWHLSVPWRPERRRSKD